MRNRVLTLSMLVSLCLTECPLEQLDYFLRLEGKCSSFSYAAYAISKLDAPLSVLKSKLRSISGVGEKTEQIILEILATKGSAYYDSLS